MIASALEPEAINTLIDCFVLEDLGCARKLVETRAKSQTIVFARVEITPDDNGGRTISIVGYWLQKGHDAIAERRICQRCIETAMRVTAEDLLTALAAEPPTGSHVPTPVPGPAMKRLDSHNRPTMTIHDDLFRPERPPPPPPTTPHPLPTPPCPPHPPLSRHPHPPPPHPPPLHPTPTPPPSPPPYTPTHTTQ